MRERKGQFKPGVSGNPSGRPKGIRNAGNLMSEALKTYSEEHGIDAQQEIINRIVSQALEGDTQSQKMIVDRLSPSFKSIMPPVELPKMPKDIFKKGERIISLVASGEISSDIARDLLSGLSSLMNVKEKTDLEERLKNLEEVYAKS